MSARRFVGTWGAYTYAALGLACGDPVNDDTDGGETGEDPMCEVAKPAALTLEPGPRALSLVARVDDIPGIADQPTDSGRRISALWPHLGRVHLGYGDYDQNTGPISMVSYVPADDAFETHGEASTEEVQRFLSYDGELFTSNVDPRGHEYDGSVFRLETACGDWEEAAPIDGAVHTYALLEHEGRIWVGTGSVVAAPALVMSSDDGGRSWREEHAVESGPESFTRILDGAALGDRMLFTGRSYPTEGATNFAWLRDGETETWSPVTGVPDVYRVIPLVFADQMLVLAWSGDLGKSDGFADGYRLEGDALVSHEWFPADFTPINWHVAAPRPEDAPWLWVLGKQDSQTVLLATSDLQTWEPIASLSEVDATPVRSLAYADNDVFLGASNGDLYVLADVFEPG
jgi:hypothetical protein